uniref:Uncharacterized protein n=1 Tax=Lactuca sativa TaxID=4236 RepID=A0A9R1UMX9_LACSA|nr:hypothetical protein LSAT_V11C800401540 [Lactuca sativa]
MPVFYLQYKIISSFILRRQNPDLNILVNVLTHTATVTLDSEHCKRINVLKKLHNAQDQKELYVDNTKDATSEQVVGSKKQEGHKTTSNQSDQYLLKKESCEGVEFDIDKKDKRKRKGSNQRVEGPDGNKRKKKKRRKQVILLIVKKVIARMILQGSSGLDVVGMNCHVTNLPKATGMVSFLLLSLSLSCFGLCLYIVLNLESIIHLFQEFKESVQSDSRHLRQEYHKITECI